MSEPKFAIEFEPTPFDTDVKRFYVPGALLTAKCPGCGTVNETDFDSEYLSYPVANCVIPYDCYCNNCDEQWTVPLCLSITLEAH